MDNFGQIKQALLEVDVDDEDATVLARKLIDEGFKDLTKIKRLDEAKLKKIGINKLFEVEAILSLAHAANRPKSTKSVVAFLSHVKKESGSEASTIYDRLTAEFPGRTFFLDSQEQFPLAHLTERVDASYVFLILASPGYIHRPFCIVELCQSLKSGAKIAVVNVVPVGTVGFDYGKVSQEIKEQGIVFYQNLLDASGWDVVKKAGYNLEDVQKAVDRFLGQKGFEFHAMGHQMVRKVELDVICQSIAPLVVEFDAQMNVPAPVAKKADAAQVMKAATAAEAKKVTPSTVGMIKLPMKKERQFTEHTDDVNCVAFSPDGKLIASGGDDKVILVRNVATGTVQLKLEGHSFSIYAIVFTPDMKFIVSGSGDKLIKIWNASSGKLEATLEGHTITVSALVISEDGSILYSGSWDYSIRVWNLFSKTCLAVWKGHSNCVNSLAITAGVIISGSLDKTVKCWSRSSGECIRTIKDHSNWVIAVAFHPNGSLFASGSRDDTIKLYDSPSSSGKCIRTLKGHSKSVYSLSFNVDGSLLASGSSDNTIKIWEVSSGRCLQTLEGHSDKVGSVSFSPDGSRLVSGSRDKTVCLWIGS